MITEALLLEDEIQAAVDYLSGLADAWRAKDIDAKWEVTRGAAAVGIVQLA